MAASIDTIEKQLHLVALSTDVDTVFRGVEATPAIPFASGCWGEVADYPATDKFGVGECVVYGSSPDFPPVSVNEAINTRLKAAGVSLVALDQRTHPTVMGWARGAYYDYSFIDGKKKLYLRWQANNAAACGRGVATSYDAIFDTIEYQLYKDVLVPLYAMRDGTLSLTDGRAALVNILGSNEDIPLPLTMDIVNAYISAVEPTLTLGEALRGRFTCGLIITF